MSLDIIWGYIKNRLGVYAEPVLIRREHLSKRRVQGGEIMVFKLPEVRVVKMFPQ
jgi:hypothetical protein